MSTNSTDNDGRGVIYFNHGVRHLARLLVSLYSLRTYARYSGPVEILDTSGGGEPWEILRRITADLPGSYACIRHIPFRQLRRNSCYVAKAGLWRHSPFATTVFLDADTIPVDPEAVKYLAFQAEDHRGVGGCGVAVTQFSDWVSNRGLVRGRVEKWLRHGGEKWDVDCRGGQKIEVDRLIAANLNHQLPAINTGVLAWCEDSPLLEHWEKLTAIGWRCPFTDELSMQLLLPAMYPRVLNDSMNCSPIYGRHAMRAGIWHAHGGKHVMAADGRGSQGHELWWPILKECWRGNVGDCRAWLPAGDARLGDWLKRQGAGELAELNQQIPTAPQAV